MSVKSERSTLTTQNHCPFHRATPVCTPPRPRNLWRSQETPLPCRSEDHDGCPYFLTRVLARSHTRSHRALLAWSSK